jgi:hypothetical protein
MCSLYRLLLFQSDALQNMSTFMPITIAMIYFCA